VIAHSGPSATPAAFVPVLAAWPTIKFVLAHAGGASWRSTAQAIEPYRNAFVDLAELIWWAGSAERAPTLEDVSVLIQRVGPDRVLFGSDFPWYEPAIGVARVRSLGLRPDETAAVLGGNASTIFGLSSPSDRPSQPGGAL
jgi:predicted TIM-barrel fold metal-dependent hydrolase